MSYDHERARFLFQTADTLRLRPLDARQLLRLAQTLHTWAVHECNGTKQREEKFTACEGYPGGGYWEPTGRVHWYNPNTGNRCGRTPDLETGALRRVAELVAQYPGLTFEHQGDPRGYVLKLVKDGREYGVPSRG